MLPVAKYQVQQTQQCQSVRACTHMSKVARTAGGPGWGEPTLPVSSLILTTCQHRYLANVPGHRERAPSEVRGIILKV